jgi:hypothetical protein
MLQNISNENLQHICIIKLPRKRNMKDNISKDLHQLVQRYGLNGFALAELTPSS